MSLIGADHHVRIARPSRNLAAAEKFWTEGVGLEVVWRTGELAPGEHDLVMLGRPGASWHLELVDDPDALAVNPPGQQDLLVIYRGSPLTSAERARVLGHGGTLRSAQNPYWDKFGVTVEDPDGYLLVLSHRLWQ